MIPKKLINQINELAKKSKTVKGLTEDEKKLQKKLRQEYLKLFREGFEQRILNLEIVDDKNNDLTPKKIKEKRKQKDNGNG